MPSLDLTLGVLEVGVFLSSVLYGIATVQAFLYTERNFKDPPFVRLMVAIVWLLETGHTIVIWALLYSLTITNYGRPSTIGDASLSLALVFPFASFLGAIVQVFFSYRVRVLSGRLIIPVIAWSGALLRCGLGLALCAMLLVSKTLPNLLAHYQWLLTTPLILNAAVDVLNTSSLSFYLLRRRPGVGFKATQKMVDRLVMYTVETGLITSLCAVAMAICSLTMPDKLIDFGLYMFYPKLFSNSFFTSLNTRNALRHAGSHSANIVSTNSFSAAPPQSNAENKGYTLELSSSQPNHLKTTPYLSPFASSLEGNTATVINIERSSDILEQA